MKIILPVDENKTDICVSFARTPYFMIYDTQEKTVEFKNNPATQEQSGAGTKAAQFIADCGVDAVITIRCGDTAADVLKLADIKIYKADQKKTAIENIEDYTSGNIEALTHFHAGFHGKQ